MNAESNSRETKREPLLRLIPYLKKYSTHIILGTLAVLLTNVAAVVTPWILRDAVNFLEQGDPEINQIVYFAALILGISVVEGIFRFLMRRILIGVSRYIEYDLRNDLFRNLQTLSASFYQKHSTGDVMARATNDLSAVRSVLGPGIMYSINTLFTAVLVVSILISISARLAILTLIPLIGVSICVKYFGKKIHQRFEKIQEQFSWLTTLAQENVAGIRVVKAYNQEKAFLKRFEEANENYIDRSMALVKIWGAFQPMLTFLLGLSLAGLLWYGGRLVVSGQITLGDFVAFIAYLAMLTWPTIALGYVINIFERGSASMGRIIQLLDALAEVHDGQAKKINQFDGAIEVKHLSFSYNGEEVLSDLSFGVQPGQTLAIVGRTGSGKSTLVNLLCHLYPVDEGTIRYDSHDINQIPVKTLRRHIGYAPQDAFLFSDTLYGNIAFGNPEASPEEVVESARISNILRDIRDLPREFETFVGERGITLSGGQKQRVTISRALLVDPKILIFDDSLSAVDTQTEEEILQRLSSEISDKTAILISHRISTVKMADQIIVLDHGKIVEKGTHEQLLQRDGYYADLYERQLLKEELEIE